MHFPRAILLALVGALGGYAQTSSGTGPNAFTNTDFNGIAAGQEFTFTWNPTTEGTVSLILRSGASSDLNVVETIASNIPNSGSYPWTPSPDSVRGSDYSMEIVSDADPSAVNYSAYFVLNSDNTVASSSASASASSVSPLPSTISTASATASNTESGSSSSTESASSSGTASRTSSTSASRTSSPSDLQATATSSTSQAAGARATAMVGMLGAVALGAIVL